MLEQIYMDLPPTQVKSREIRVFVDNLKRLLINVDVLP